MSPFSIPPFPALNLTSLSFFFILQSLCSVIFSHFPSFLPSFLLHSLLSSLIPPSSPPTLLYLFLFSPRLYGCLLVFVSLTPPYPPPPHPPLHLSFTTDGPKADIDSSNKVGVYTLINISAPESGWCFHKASKRSGTSCSSAR
jgi:hypothetical protein